MRKSRGSLLQLRNHGVDLPRAPHTVQQFSPLRQQQVDWLTIAQSRHLVHALVDVDVTDARQAVRVYRSRSGSPLSFTSFLVFVLANTIDEDRSLHGYRLGRRQLVMFDEVDVAVTVEHDIDGQKLPMPHLVRAANRKSVTEVQDALTSAQVEFSMSRWLQRVLPVWLLVPGKVRRALWSLILRNPHRRKRIAGTAMVTSVGMFGSGSGWGVPTSIYSICLTIGSVSRKPVVMGSEIAIREVMCITISLDHDVIDGAPAARFIQRLKNAIEKPDPGSLLEATITAPK